MARDGVISGMNGGSWEGFLLVEPVAASAGQNADEVFRRLSVGQVTSAYRLAWAILGNGLDAEDAAQDAFVSAWRQRTTLRDPEKFDAWFCRILVNCCRDRLRSRARLRRRSIPTAGESTVDPAEAAAERDALDKALDALDPDRRIVVVLRFWMDFSVDDIADRLGIPAGTVKSRLHSSMRQLRAALEEAR